MAEEAVKERIKVNVEKLKLVATVIVLIIGGLIGLLFKEVDLIFRGLLFALGFIADVVSVVYFLRLNTQIEELLISLEDQNV